MDVSQDGSINNDASDFFDGSDAPTADLGNPDDATADLQPPDNCGNGRIDDGETCDLTNLNGNTCADHSSTRIGGELVCASDCKSFELNDCKLQYRQISAGANHTCATKTDNTIICWGDDSDEKLNAPQGEFREVHVGERHSCGLKTDGTIVCWGSDEYELEGVISLANQTTAPAGSFDSLYVGGYHSCALNRLGKATCWGLDNFGQTNLNENDESYLSLGLGRIHSCGITDAGKATCVGWNFSNQIDVPDDNTSYKMIAGASEHTCAIRQDDTIRCWGNMENMGDPPLGKFRELSNSWYQNIALDMSGTAEYWGVYAFPGTLPKFRSISVGRNYFCGISQVGAAI